MTDIMYDSQNNRGEEKIARIGGQKKCARTGDLRKDSQARDIQGRTYRTGRPRQGCGNRTART
jgi:hypothetical protein